MYVNLYWFLDLLGAISFVAHFLTNIDTFTIREFCKHVFYNLTFLEMNPRVLVGNKLTRGVSSFKVYFAAKRRTSK